MNFKNILLAGALAISASAFAQDKAIFQWYGFIRNFYTYDSRFSKSGGAELYNYLPLDVSLNSQGQDINAVPTGKWSSLTSRLGLDIKGYSIGDYSISAKIESDFYSGLNGVSGTATLRLRNAYMDINSAKGWRLRLGQFWHPFAEGLPDCIALESAVPFGPFQRTPQINFLWSADNKWSLNAVASWQVQYVSAGPEGASANYQKYSRTPELYAGVYYSDKGFSARLGVDMLSISPRIMNNDKVLINERLTSFMGLAYLQYKSGLFLLKAKSVLAQAGESMNMLGGYGVCAINEDGSRKYTPTLTSSSWLSLSYGKIYKASLFAGYAKCLGTMDPLLPAVEGSAYAATSAVDNTSNKSIDTGNYLCKSAYPNVNSAFRLAPTLSWNPGRFTLALEYQLTAAQYGAYTKLASTDGKITYTCVGLNGLTNDNLHWVYNHRIQIMTKFTF